MVNRTAGRLGTTSTLSSLRQGPRRLGALPRSFPQCMQGPFQYRKAWWHRNRHQAACASQEGRLLWPRRRHNGLD